MKISNGLIAIACCLLVPQAVASHSADEAAFQSAFQKNQRIVTVARNKYSEAVTFYLYMQEVGRQLMARQAMIDRLIAEGEMDPPDENSPGQWLGFSVGTGVQPHLPRTIWMTADLCRSVDARQSMSLDALRDKAQELRQMQAVQEQETEDFWRAHYYTLDWQARAEIDERMRELPDTDEVTQTDYAQVALDAPQEFKERLVRICGSRVAITTHPQETR